MSRRRIPPVPLNRKRLTIIDAFIGWAALSGVVGAAGTGLGLGDWFIGVVAILFGVLTLAAYLFSWAQYIAYVLRPLPVRKPIPPWTRTAVFARDGYRCRRCNTVHDLQIDHVTPVSWGGGNELSNLQTLCGRCNRRKGNRYRG